MKLSFIKKKKRKAPDPSRRALVLFGAQAAVLGVLAWRMRQLQVVESDQYLTLAEDNRINVQILAPARGRIFDRNGEPLADNRQNYRVQIVREQVDDPKETIRKLGDLIDLPDSTRERILKEMAGKSGFVPVVVAEHLEWKDFALINANAPALPGVAPEVGLTRFYPEAEALAHVVGYVAAVSEEEVARDKTRDPLLQLPDFKIGKNGIEREAEAHLRGSAGARRIEVNAVGRIIRELDRDEGGAGADVNLTIDLGLQRFAMERVIGQSVSATVIDVENGDVVAMASAPGFNPNSFVFGISHREWGSLTSNKLRPLTNKPISDLYPPGSTFKMLVALAGLHTGAISPHETVFCNGRYKLGRRYFHCWKRGGHGHKDMRGAIQHSCDVYFYDIAKRIGIDAIADMAAKFGIGEAGPLEIPNIKAGLLPTKEWKRANRGEGWQVGDTLNAGIGQGFLLTTPLQLAVMASRLASGKRLQPRLIRAIDGVERPPVPAEELGVRRENLDVVRDGMNLVSNHKRGTAYRSRIVEPTMLMAGKTGTAQVRRITTAERATGVIKNRDLPWEQRDHALFVAYAPVDKPKYAISVVVEHGGGGSKAAAPIARDILLRALYGTEPPLEAYPSVQRKTIEEERLQRALQVEAMRAEMAAVNGVEGVRIWSAADIAMPPRPEPRPFADRVAQERRQ